MPDYLPGRDTPQLEDEGQQGRFFSSFPASTPKFALNRGSRRSEFIETMARMIISVPEGYEQLIDTLPGDVRAAASTLLTKRDVSRGTSNGSGAGYFDFLLTGVSQQHQEREQVVDTLTDNTVVFYGGQSLPMLSCNGYFYNTYQDDQNVWFQLLYAELLRGTMLARRNLVVSFRYDSFFMTGYLTGLQTNLEGGAKNYVQFAFTFRVKQIQITTPIIYNPSRGRSLLVDNLFVPDAPANVSDTDRVGIETPERPPTASAVPAATARQAETDTRVVPGEVQIQSEFERLIDAILSEQTTAAAAQLPTTAPAAEALDTAADALVRGAGDVRPNLHPEDQQRIQDFSSPVPTSTVPMNDLSQELRNTVAATARGTVVISPVTGVAERSGSYADSIARQLPADLVADIRARSTAGSDWVSPSTAPTDPLADVYRPPAELVAQVSARLAELGALRAEATQQLFGTPAGRRTRSRATG